MDDLNLQEHYQGLSEEIEDLLMTNKLLSKEKEEQRAAIEEGDKKNIAMKRNIEEVRILMGNYLKRYSEVNIICFQLEDLLESQQSTWSMKVQKIESDKNNMLDKKEKIFSHEVENMKLQFIEGKEQLKEIVNELSKEKEHITQENRKLFLND